MSVVSLGGCEDSDADECRGLDLASEALFGGSPRLDGDSDLAVVALLSVTGKAQEELCSGVLISPGLVLTAKHCAREGVQINVLFGRSTEHTFAEVPVDHFKRDPDRDLAIGVLQTSDLPDVEPLMPVLDEVPAVGDPVTIAGFGLEENGGIGRLLFAEEDVSAIGDETLTVDGMGESGACIGDSGGPLLLHDPDSGNARVAGILSVGSPSCSDLDVYQRLDTVSDFILDALEDDNAQPGFNDYDANGNYVGGC